MTDKPAESAVERCEQWLDDELVAVPGSVVKAAIDALTKERDEAVSALAEANKWLNADEPWIQVEEAKAEVEELRRERDRLQWMLKWLEKEGSIDGWEIDLARRRAARAEQGRGDEEGRMEV